MKAQLIFAWYDLWVGAFWDKKKKWLYVFLIPMLGLIIKFNWKCCQCKKKLEFKDVRFYTSNQPMCYECNKSETDFDNSNY